MNRTIVIFGLILVISLAGCIGTPTAAPTSTATAPKFIHVASPTNLNYFTRTATPSATLVASEVITNTTPIPTATETPTPTPTPIPPTVNELPDPSGYIWQEVASGLNQPEGLVNAGDGSGRLFIVEQAGLIRVYENGAILTTPFLNLTPKVVCCGERGLLGLVFHPRYVENGYFYVDYTEEVSGKTYTVIARYNVSSNDPNQADPGSETRLLQIEQPYQNHKGGQLQFGPDGCLYIGMGDGGSEGDPLGNGQSLDTLLGKILRIDVDGQQPYTIPPDNPFVNGGGLAEIWAYGLRNPWRFSFDRLTGDLYIGDVGQDAWEEIDYLPAGSSGGANFGWNYFEGSHPYRGSPPADMIFVMPVAEYSHSLGNAVIGGYVYRGNQLLDWYGVYLYADYGSGRVWGLLHLPDGSWQNAQLFDTGKHISTFGVDENGGIYMVDDTDGTILMLK
jgi:glucose/arabinose dehydrogenase